MPIFERHKSITIDWADENSLEVVSHMKDKFHEIKTVITFDCNSRQITRADAQMITVPFDLCHEVCIKMKELVGLQLKKGVIKWISEIIGTSRGCSHLVDMVADSVKAVVQTVDFCMLPEELEIEQKLEKIQTVNMGICYTYSNLDRRPKYIGNRDF